MPPVRRSWKGAWRSVVRVPDGIRIERLQRVRRRVSHGRACPLSEAGSDGRLAVGTVIPVTGGPHRSAQKGNRRLSRSRWGTVAARTPDARRVPSRGEERCVMPPPRGASLLPA